jgi:oligosaccharyltransferase complex subunit beta
MSVVRCGQTYSITIAQHETTANGTSGWKEFHASDIQLDFTMLDPHIRTTLSEEGPDEEGTKYSVTFKAPDRHGVFKFMVDYWRPG